ncbi:MAG: hypothetical protein R2728_08670 [Chitinophagales bacterium]
MTYCLAFKLKTGIVGFADTRITSGTETTNAKKLYTNSKTGQSIFLMTSGLRSIRDKSLTYFKEVLEDGTSEFKKFYEIANLLGEQLKRVADEDRKSIEKAGLSFNLHTIVGGQCKEDDEHKLFLLYPEGNWIEISKATPFVIIGNSGYGKPILNRTITYQSSLKFALKTGFLSFDSTRVSANDVGYPLDVFIYEKNSFKFIEKRYKESSLSSVSKFWGKRLEQAVHDLPDEWTNDFLKEH